MLYRVAVFDTGCASPVSQATLGMMGDWWPQLSELYIQVRLFWESRAALLHCAALFGNSVTLSPPPLQNWLSLIMPSPPLWKVSPTTSHFS